MIVVMSNKSRWIRSFMLVMIVLVILSMVLAMFR